MMFAEKSLIYRLLAVMVPATVLLAACGDDSESGDGANPGAMVNEALDDFQDETVEAAPEDAFGDADISQEDREAMCTRLDADAMASVLDVSEVTISTSPYGSGSIGGLCDLEFDGRGGPLEGGVVKFELGPAATWGWDDRPLDDEQPFAGVGESAFLTDAAEYRFKRELAIGLLSVPASVKVEIPTEHPDLGISLSDEEWRALGEIALTALEESV